MTDPRSDAEARYDALLKAALLAAFNHGAECSLRESTTASRVARAKELQVALDALRVSAPRQEPALFSYSGPIYVRPVGRGICFGGADGCDAALEEVLPDGHYQADVVIRAAPPPEES